MRKKSSADKLGDDKEGSEFKTWDADISITDAELSELCTIHSASTKPSGTVSTGTKNSTETTSSSESTKANESNSSSKRP